MKNVQHTKTGKKVEKKSTQKKKYPRRGKSVIYRPVHGCGSEGLGSFEMICLGLSVECVENHITLGEICNTLRGVWGEYVAEGF